MMYYHHHHHHDRAGDMPTMVFNVSMLTLAVLSVVLAIAYIYQRYTSGDIPLAVTFSQLRINTKPKIFVSMRGNACLVYYIDNLIILIKLLYI